jgi:putative transposase
MRLVLVRFILPGEHRADDRPARLLEPAPVYLSLGRTDAERAGAYRQLFRGQIDEVLLARVRNATNRGMALGNERFVAEVGTLSGRRVVSLKRGRKARIEA